ncbi:MAG: hypothetical protein PUD59_00140 [bacterium]|nr:hypothetical protein [bacterium]
MNEYLIPANANRGKLIFGFFRPIDLIVFGTGAFITLILLFVFQNSLSELSVAIGVLSPALITGFLVLPVPNQHNIMVVISNIYKFYFVERRKYIWRGWCSLNGKED